MRKVKYTGDESKEIGRFGPVNPGDILEMQEYEYQIGLDSNQFEAVSPVDAPAEKAIGLRGAEAYDLRTVRWEDTPQYLFASIKRRGHQELTAMVSALAELGIDINTSFPLETSRDVADHIHTLAAINGWTKLKSAERTDSPAWDGKIVEAVEPEPVKVSVPVPMSADEAHALASEPEPVAEPEPEIAAEPAIEEAAAESTESADEQPRVVSRRKK